MLSQFNSIKNKTKCVQNTHLENQKHFSFLGFKRLVLDNVIKTTVCIVELGMLLQNTEGPCWLGPAGSTDPPTMMSAFPPTPQSFNP